MAEQRNCPAYVKVENRCLYGGNTSTHPCRNFGEGCEVMTEEQEKHPQKVRLILENARLVDILRRT